MLLFFPLPKKYMILQHVSGGDLENTRKLLSGSVLKNHALQTAPLLPWTESQGMAIEVPDRFGDPNIKESMFHFLLGSWEAASPCSSLCHHGLDRQKHLYWVPRQTDLRKIHRAFMCPSGVQGQQVLFHGTDIV